MGKVEDLIKKHKNKFFKVKCGSCNNEQTIFEAASIPVKCIVCNQVLATTTASKIELKAKIVKEFE